MRTNLQLVEFQRAAPRAQIVDLQVNQIRKELVEVVQIEAGALLFHSDVQATQFDQQVLQELLFELRELGQRQKIALLDRLVCVEVVADVGEVTGDRELSNWRAF